MFCNQCGAQLKGDERFCNACGAPVPHAVSASTGVSTASVICEAEPECPVDPEQTAKIMSQLVLAAIILHFVIFAIFLVSFLSTERSNFFLKLCIFYVVVSPFVGLVLGILTMKKRSFRLSVAYAVLIGIHSILWVCMAATVVSILLNLLLPLLAAVVCILCHKYQQDKPIYDAYLAQTAQQEQQ